MYHTFTTLFEYKRAPCCEIIRNNFKKMDFDDEPIMILTSTISNEKIQSVGPYTTVTMDSLATSELETFEPLLTLSKVSSETTTIEKDQIMEDQKSFLPIPELYKDITLVTLLAILFLRFLEPLPK